LIYFAIYQKSDASKTKIFIFFSHDNNLAVHNIPATANLQMRICLVNSWNKF